MQMADGFSLADEISVCLDGVRDVGGIHTKNSIFKFHCFPRNPGFSIRMPRTRRDLLVHGPLVVTFYRGVWCPFCNLDLVAPEAVREEIEARGAQLLAISPQTLANSRRSQRDNKLNFPILSDPDSEVAETFGLRFSLPDDFIEVYKSFGSNLSHFNAGQDWRFPMPARYVIGRDGLIAYADVNPDYTRRPDPSELLPVLDKLR